ncbi:MAG: putative cytokinetic ring protein SteA [Chloroherpetonaceae bacterium]|nr:putative cytokinetic ring protein SteA [Chthonomonadaceae bacterium]MDW8207543.1 putative cytokinetic ring protein SteA [Chloroherpetonaceae bacterium]
MVATGPHRVLKDRRTKNLCKRLRPGDIALIHHTDLDVTAARALRDCGVAAVVNAAASISGRYPNRGPLLLLEAGIPLLDRAGDAAFERVPDGAIAVLQDNTLRLRTGDCIQGERLTYSRVQELMEAARANLSEELDRFARNTLDYLSQEKSLLHEELDVPELKTRIAGQHVLIVVRGEGYREDLAMLNDYLRDARPVIIAVDGGADALLEARLRPHIILGDMDSVSDAALRCGAELVVHGYAREDRKDAPGLARLKELGLDARVFAVRGTSEDAAMLLADALGARVIVAVGTHFSLEEFLDKGRNGMASTFLTRLRIGSKLVDAKGIARLWERRHLRLWEVGLMLCAAASPLVAVFLLSPAGRNWLRIVSVSFGLHFR